MGGRLERGNLAGATAGVLAAVARASRASRPGPPAVPTLPTSLRSGLCTGIRAAVVDELTRDGETFAGRWAAHEVRQRSFGHKRVCHRGVGHLELAYETLTLPTEPDLMMIVLTAAPGSASADALRLLPVWAADGQG